MCCNTTSRYIKRHKIARLLAALFCVFFIAALALSSTFILTHANHEHDNNGVNGSCGACAHIVAAENLLKTISTAVAISAFSLGVLYAALLMLKFARFGIAENTLIGLKVRLNN